MSVEVMRAEIHASLGTYEDLSHVLHLRAKSGYTGAHDTAECLALAARIAAAWSSWFNYTITDFNFGERAVKACFTDALSYDKIAMSYLNYPGGGDPPETVTPTVTYTLPTALAGTGTGAALPLEVACCLTLLTDQTGPSTRGRLYLGGLPTDWLAAHSGGAEVAGLFDPQFPRKIAAAFGTLVIDGIHNDSAAHFEVNVVSRKNGSARGVGGIKVGQVPDSQRRRRWHQPENPYLAWGTAS